MKSFVIDTNVFIHRPDALLSFKDNEIVVPLGVLEELDRLKTYSDEKGRNARHAIRFLDEASRHGNLKEGVKIENGSILRVVQTKLRDIPTDLEMDKADNRIILAAYALLKEGKQVFFVSLRWQKTSDVRRENHKTNRSLANDIYNQIQHLSFCQTRTRTR